MSATAKKALAKRAKPDIAKLLRDIGGLSTVEAASLSYDGMLSQWMFRIDPSFELCRADALALAQSDPDALKRQGGLEGAIGEAQTRRRKVFASRKLAEVIEQAEAYRNSAG
jgi:hypothetical protein